MDSAEFEALSRELHEELTSLQIRVEEACGEQIGNFSCPVVDSEKAEGGVRLNSVCNRFGKKLEGTMLSCGTRLNEGLPKGVLHTYLTLVSDMDQEGKKQDLLMKHYEKEIERLRKETKEADENRKQMEKLMDDRKKVGEMVELQGYSYEEIRKMEQATFKMFVTHRDRLNQTLPKLFPKCKDKMSEILAALAETAFEDTGSKYLKLDEHKNLVDVAQILLKIGIVTTHSVNKGWITLAVID